MRIIYPYNEILPKKKAHDVFVFHECAAFAEAGYDTTLLIGRGSKEKELFTHYQISNSNPLKINTIIHIRKNNLFGISWNLPFFLGCQRRISKERPDYVILSVRKQAAYHLLHKLPGVRYIYEVHELSFYPNHPKEQFEITFEKMMLRRTDLIVVTTQALKEILLNPPYSLKVPIEVIPLAVHARTIPLPPSPQPFLQLAYVGQLYPGQGLTTLLAAMTKVQNVRLKIIGGKDEEIHHLSKLSAELNLSDVVEFSGFVSPYQIPAKLENAHAFVAPFENKGRMPYVAHTKLFEYAEWGRPIIAPNLPIVEEHFEDGKGVLLFESGNATSLAGCIQTLQQSNFLEQLQKDILSYAGHFSWKTRIEKYSQILGLAETK